MGEGHGSILYNSRGRACEKEAVFSIICAGARVRRKVREMAEPWEKMMKMLLRQQQQMNEVMQQTSEMMQLLQKQQWMPETSPVDLEVSLDQLCEEALEVYEPGKPNLRAKTEPPDSDTLGWPDGHDAATPRREVGTLAVKEQGGNGGDAAATAISVSDEGDEEDREFQKFLKFYRKIEEHEKAP